MNAAKLGLVSMLFLLGVLLLSSVSSAQATANPATACNSIRTFPDGVVGEYYCTVFAGQNISLNLFTAQVQSISPYSYPAGTTEGYAIFNIYYNGHETNASAKLDEGDIGYYTLNGTQYQIVYYGANTLNSSVNMSVIAVKITTPTTTIMTSPPPTCQSGYTLNTNYSSSTYGLCIKSNGGIASPSCPSGYIVAVYTSSEAPPNGEISCYNSISSTLTQIFANQSITSGNIKATLIGVSPSGYVTFNIYNDGVLTNTNSIAEFGTSTLTSNGTVLSLAVNLDHYGVYSYQQWAAINLAVVSSEGSGGGGAGTVLPSTTTIIAPTTIPAVPTVPSTTTVTPPSNPTSTAITTTTVTQTGNPTSTAITTVAPTSSLVPTTTVQQGGSGGGIGGIINAIATFFRNLFKGL